MTEETKTKNFKKADYSVFESALAHLGGSASGICEAMGYSPGSWKRWKEEGKIPFVASIALEGLRRRQGGGKVLMIRATSGQQVDMVRALIKGLGLEMVEV